MKMDTGAVGIALRIARKKKKLTQAQVSKLTHCSRVTIARYEKGQRSMKSNILKILAEAVDLDLDNLPVIAAVDGMKATAFFCSHCGRKNIVESK